VGDLASIDRGGEHACSLSPDGRLACWGNNEAGQLGDGTFLWRPLPVLVGDDDDWATVATGGNFTCGSKVDGSLWCWGNNFNGELGLGMADGTFNVPQRVGTANDWVGVDAGTYWACGIRSDASLWCWGHDGFGELLAEPTPRYAGAWASVSLGFTHTCGIQTDGTLWCWGDNSYTQLGGPIGQSDEVCAAVTPVNATSCIAEGCGFKGTAPAGQRCLSCSERATRSECQPPGGYTGCRWSDFDSACVYVGASNNCGPSLTWSSQLNCCTSPSDAFCCVDPANPMWCGPGSGAGSSTNASTPVQVGTDADWAVVSSGDFHTCALKGDGALYCWGYNAHGALGLGAAGLDEPITRVGDADDWTGVASGGSSTCALNEAGHLWCTGNNDLGQVGDGTGVNRASLVPVSGPGGWTRVTVGADGACGLRGGVAFCWGSNKRGQVGIGTPGDKAAPMRVDPRAGWSSVSAGADHICALRQDGSLWCSGRNFNGQLGDGTQTSRSLLWQREGSGWSAVEGAGANTFGIIAPSTLHGWGYNSSGQLGNGQTVAGIHDLFIRDDAARVAAGFYSVSMISTTGALYAWGDNSAGQLGDGSQTLRTTPTPIGGDTDWVAIGRSSRVAWGLRGAARRLWMWGANEYGQLGLGHVATPIPTPARVDADASWSEVASTSVSTCGIRTDGTLWCWGNNAYGQLGDGTTLSRAIPEQVGGDADWVTLAASRDPEGNTRSHTCAIKIDGTLWCWGNSRSITAYGVWTPVVTPTRIGSDADWASITVGSDLTCGVKQGGELFCFGRNAYGAHGDGVLWIGAPVAVLEP